MTANSAMDNAVDTGDDSAASANNGEGVVHGHIHNYDNMTYIHGHVHHGHQDSPETAVAATRRVQTVDGNVGWGIPSLVAANYDDLCHKYADCQHFEFVNYHTAKSLGDVAAGAVGTAGNAANAGNAGQVGKSSVYDGVSTTSAGKVSSTGDPMLLPMRDKRSFSDVINNETVAAGLDCRCNPKVLEVCCDVDHVPSSVATEDTLLDSAPHTTENDLVVCTDVKNDFFMIPTDDECILENELPGINCDLTCVCASEELHARSTCNDDDEQERCKEAEDDIFENFCKECVNLNQDRCQDHRHHHHHHHNIHTHGSPTHSTLATPSSTPSSSGENSQNEFASTSEVKGGHATNNCLAACHDHVVNSQMDLRVLDELCGISSLYELPFADHMNHHNHTHVGTNGHGNQGVNLLRSSIGANVSGDYDGSALHHHQHHHHRIQFHQHGSKQDSPKSHPQTSIPWQQHEQTAVKPKMEDQASVHHCSNPLNYNNYGMEASTINFNWLFKNEDAKKLKCEWDQCYEQFPTLIDLQKHMFRDHVSQENVASNVSCSWNDCQFKGEDICSLVNHINSDHGINFGMKVLDPASLLEQKEQHHLQHRSDQQCKVGKLQCEWNDCGQLFATAEELSNHLEKFHLPRGQSEYQCYWKGCSRKFTQRQKMVRHLKVHSGYKPFKCQVCLKFFSSEDTLNQHMRIHSGEKPFKCHLCGKKFSVSSSLRIHIRTHTGEKPLQCKVCGKRFNESSNLNKHLKTHRKKFKCNYCTKSFDTCDKCECHELICLAAHRQKLK